MIGAMADPSDNRLFGRKKVLLDSIADLIDSEIHSKNLGHDIANKLSCKEFAEEHLRTEKGEKLDFIKKPYLKDLYNDSSPNQVYMKASQVCITTMFINKMLYRSLREPGTIIFTLPTSGDVLQLSSTRFNASMRFSTLASFLNADIDNAGLKHIGQSFIYFRGTWNERQAISVPADLNIHDELNFSKPTVVGMYKPRLKASKYKGTWLASTPTFTKTLIDDEFENSNKQYWMIPCPSCGKKQHLTFEHIVKQKSKSDEDEYAYVCKKCGEVIAEEDKLEGKWTKTKKHKRNGYFLNRLVVYGETATLIYNEYLEAKRKHELSIFYNFTLGLPYADENSRILNYDVLAIKCVKDYEMLNACKQGTIMGVDQADNLHITIATPAVEEKNRKIIHLEVADNFERVKQLIKLFNVEVAVIDALPNKHSAKKVKDAFPKKVFLNYYNDAVKLWRGGQEKWEIVSNRTKMLDATAYEKVDGRCDIPDIHIPIVQEFIEQSCNMIRIVKENKHGIKHVVWEKTGPDHWRHSDLYCNLAGRIRKKLLKSRVSISVS